MHIVDDNSNCLLGFVFEKIDKCGLSTFDLRGDHRLLAAQRHR